MAGSAARWTLGERRLRAHTRVAARSIAGTAGAVLGLALLLRLLVVLGIKLADEHRPDRFPGGNLGKMIAISPGPDKFPGGTRGNEAVASPRLVIDRKPVQAPGGTRGNTVLPSGQGPVKAP